MANNQPCCEKFKTMIGGQALIEGIMMRGPEKDQSVLLQTPVQGPAADTQHLCRFGAVAAAAAQGIFNQLPFIVIQRSGDKLDRFLFCCRRFPGCCRNTVPDVFRNIIHRKRFPFGKDHHSFHGVPQFPDISRPRIIFQKFQCLRLDPGHGPFIFLCCLPEKTPGKRRNIIPPLPQGGHLNGYTFQTVKKIFPERPFFDHCRKIPVGGADQTGITMDLFRAADALNGTGLQNTQEFDLGGGIDFPDLIQEQRSAVCQFKTSPVPFCRARKSAFFIAK